MARPAYGARPTYEGSNAIDIRCLHRDGMLHAGRTLSLSWTRTR
jgi:hypothetical protein